ncbi:hypothetical protein D9M68_832670 [compost metagenome]
MYRAGQQARRQRRQGGDGHRASVRVARLPGVGDQVFNFSNHTLNSWKQFQTLRRQVYGPAIAIEQRCAQMRFELLDLYGERRLRDVQLVRGPGEVSEASDREKRAELLEIPQHCRSSIRCRDR